MWNESTDIYEPGYAERWLPYLKNNGEKTFALRVVGDSMTARFGKSYPDGCIIFVDPEQRTPTNGDRIVAKLEDSELVTFKVFTQDAGRIWLRPLNASHPPIHDKFTVIGKIVGKWEDE
jgi:SOS-response transcriptional repressor LexA